MRTYQLKIIMSETIKLTGFNNSQFYTRLALLLENSSAGLCTMKFKLVYSCLKHFWTLNLHNDFVAYGSPNSIEL